MLQLLPLSVGSSSVPWTRGCGMASQCLVPSAREACLEGRAQHMRHGLKTLGAADYERRGCTNELLHVRPGIRLLMSPTMDVRPWSSSAASPTWPLSSRCRHLHKACVICRAVASEAWHPNAWCSSTRTVCSKLGPLQLRHDIHTVEVANTEGSHWRPSPCTCELAAKLLVSPYPGGMSARPMCCIWEMGMPIFKVPIHWGSGIFGGDEFYFYFYYMYVVCGFYLFIF